MATNSRTNNWLGNWAAFQDVLAAQTGGQILSELIAEVVLSVLPSKAEAQNDLTFVAPDRQRYRIILVRHSVYGNGRRDFIINMVQTIKRNYGGDNRTSILTAGIMLAARFRSLFLEERSRYGLRSFNLLGDEEFDVQLGQMLTDMKQINAEAADEGLSDQTALIQLVGNRVQVQALFKKWWAAVMELEDAAQSYLEKPSPEAKDGFLNRHREMIIAVAPINATFTNLALAAYQSVINSNDGGRTPSPTLPAHYNNDKQ